MGESHCECLMLPCWLCPRRILAIVSTFNIPIFAAWKPEPRRLNSGMMGVLISLLEARHETSWGPALRLLSIIERKRLTAIM